MKNKYEHLTHLKPCKLKDKYLLENLIQCGFKPIKNLDLLIEELYYTSIDIFKKRNQLQEQHLNVINAPNLDDEKARKILNTISYYSKIFNSIEDIFELLGYAFIYEPNKKQKGE